jgi:hypothetical protein
VFLSPRVAFSIGPPMSAFLPDITQMSPAAPTNNFLNCLNIFFFCGTYLFLLFPICMHGHSTTFLSNISWGKNCLHCVFVSQIQFKELW